MTESRVKAFEEQDQNSSKSDLEQHAKDLAAAASEKVVHQQQLEANHKRVDDLHRSITFRNRIFVGTTLLGSSLILSGFLLWYARVQKHQDLLLRKQVAAEEKPQPD